MKNHLIPLLIFLVISVSGCDKKTNKESRQFESLVETKAISKDGKELITYSLNFYVFESKGENLFDEKGFFISENYEVDLLAETLVRSGVRNVIGKYNQASLLTIDKMELSMDL